MVSAISFGWFADFGKTLTIIQRSSQPVYSDKWQAPIVGRNMLHTFGHRLAMCCDMLGVAGSSLKVLNLS